MAAEVDSTHSWRKEMRENVVHRGCSNWVFGVVAYAARLDTMCALVKMMEKRLKISVPISFK